MEKTGAIDISLISLFLGFILLLIPIYLSYILKLRIIKSMFIAVLRMCVQLFLIALFLKYLFIYDNTFLNIAWLFIMILVASFTIIRNSNVNIKIFILPSFLSFILTLLIVLTYFNKIIVGLDNIFQAKYFIIIGGMLLGNSLRSNIVGISTFYKSILRNEERYLYSLSLGAGIFEAIRPYLKEALLISLRPSIATMTTMGIVSLPGMMTGQIIGGSSPLTAIKYQIAIMIAIFSGVSLTVTLTILFTIKRSFNKYGILKNNIFSNKE